MHKVIIGQKKLLIPSGVADLSGQLLQHFINVAFLPSAVFSPDPQKAGFFRQMAFLQLGFSSYNRHLKRLTDFQFLQVVQLLKWVNQPIDAKPIISEIQLGKQKCIAPAKGMQNSTFIEYAMADGCFSMLEEQPELMNKLIAVLYRPANSTRPDGREKLSTALIEQNTELAGKLPNYQKLAIAQYFAACKVAIFKQYDCWEKPLPTGEETTEKATTSQPINWADFMLGIAESQVFGNLEQVKEANIHEVFLYLQRNKKQTEELKRKYGNS